MEEKDFRALLDTKEYEIFKNKSQAGGQNHAAWSGWKLCLWDKLRNQRY